MACCMALAEFDFQTLRTDFQPHFSLRNGLRQPTWNSVGGMPELDRMVLVHWIRILV